MEKILNNSIVSLIGVIIAGLGVAFEKWKMRISVLQAFQAVES